MICRPIIEKSIACKKSQQLHFVITYFNRSNLLCTSPFVIKEIVQCRSFNFGYAWVNVLIKSDNSSDAKGFGDDHSPSNKATFSTSLWWYDICKWNPSRWALQLSSYIKSDNVYSIPCWVKQNVSLADILTDINYSNIRASKIMVASPSLAVDSPHMLNAFLL